MTCLERNVLPLSREGLFTKTGAWSSPLKTCFSNLVVMRTISLGSHYLVSRKQLRNVLQFVMLGREMFPGLVKIFMEAYKSATYPFGYLLPDFKSTPSNLWCLINILRKIPPYWEKISGVGSHGIEPFDLMPEHKLRRSTELLERELPTKNKENEGKNRKNQTKNRIYPVLLCGVRICCGGNHIYGCYCSGHSLPQNFFDFFLMTYLVIWLWWSWEIVLKKTLIETGNEYLRLDA